MVSKQAMLSRPLRGRTLRMGFGYFTSTADEGGRVQQLWPHPPSGPKSGPYDDSTNEYITYDHKNTLEILVSVITKVSNESF